MAATWKKSDGDIAAIPRIVSGFVAPERALELIPGLTEWFDEPFADASQIPTLLVAELTRFKGAEVVWCQEEPRNMGAWHFIEPYLEWVLNQINAPNKRPRYAGRAAAAATATGLMSKHLAQLKALLDDALN